MRFKNKSNNTFTSLKLRSSYQHTVVAFSVLLGLLCFVSAHAQPHAIQNVYTGLNFKFSKSKNPQELLNWLNNSGYPYAQIELDTLFHSENYSELRWNVATGKYVTLDTIEFNNTFNKKILTRCINYQIGQAYSSDKVKNIAPILNQISFIKPNSSVVVRMEQENFSLKIQTERKRMNNLSALVALQPKPNTTQSMLTGNIDLSLFNALKQAETIEFHWKRPQPKSQSLSFKLGSPFTAGLPIGFQFEFSSFLRDSTFSSTQFNLRLLTKMNDLNGFSAAILRTTNTHFSNILNFGNTQNNAYSLRFAQFKPGASLFNFLIEATAGNRIIQYDSHLSSKKFYSLLYKSWSEVYWNPLLFTRLNAEINYTASDSLFNNELNRIGGTKNLRGFVEESIYASKYALLSSDFGVKLGEEIQTYIFGDFGYVYEPIRRNYYDAGIGFQFQQENGSVAITYGVGNLENKGLQLQNGRVGLTFASRF